MSFVSFEIGNVNVICIDPNIAESSIDDLLALLPSGARIAIYDLIPTSNICSFVLELQKDGYEILFFKDHSFVSKYRGVKNLPQFKQVRNFDLRFRRTTRSCTEMIEVGEFVDSDVQIVITSRTLDGFLSACRGCGIDYNGMINDAEMADGAKRTPTEFGNLASYAFHLIPPYFSQNPEGHIRELSRVFQNLALWLMKRLAQEKLNPFLVEIETARRRSFENAEQVARDSEFAASGLIYADALPLIEQGERIDWNHLRTNLLKRHPAKIMVFATSGTGLQGMQIFLNVSKRFRSRIDLRNFDGVLARVSGQGSVLANDWERFLASWKEGGFDPRE